MADAFNDCSEKAYIREVGDRIGYGRIMQLCEEIWREKDIAAGRSGGEHTVGPCGFFMVPCPLDHQGCCDICCGAGRVTKGVAELLKSSEIQVIEENRILREALFPRPEIKDCTPLILYFGDKQERDEFIAAVAEAKPNMRSYKI